MLQYQRYIFRNLLFVLGMTLLGLTAILWLMQTLRLVDFIVNQGIPVYLFLKLSVLLLPSMIMLVMPVAIGIAVIFLYHRLRTDSELVVLQSTGLSKAQLAMPGVHVAVLASVLAYIISFFILPASTKEFRDMQFFLRNNYVSVLLQDGVFSTPVNGLTVYVRERVGEKTFRGVMVHDSRNPASPITMMAEKADLENTAEGPQFLLYNGNRQELRGEALSFLQFDSYILDIGVYTRGIGGRKQDVEEQSVPELINASSADYTDIKDYRQAVASGHQRIMWPMMSLSIAIGVLGVVLSGRFNRRMRWRRNIAAALLVIVTIVAMVAMRGFMARYLWTIPIGYIVVVSPAILGVFSLWPSKLRAGRRLALG